MRGQYNYELFARHACAELFAVTPTALERRNAVILFLVVALSPLPLGANRAWAWILLATLFFACFAIQAWCDLSNPGSASQSLARLRGSVLAFGLVLIWAAAQTVSWTPSDWRHPGFAAIGVEGSISVHPERSAQFGLRLVGYAMAFWVAVRVGRDPRIARRGLMAIALSASTLAVFGMGRIFWLGEYGERLSASFVNQNSFATFAGFGAVISAGFLGAAFRRVDADREVKGRELVRRRLLKLTGKGALPLALCLICLSGVLMTGSRGGVFATTSALVAMGALHFFAYGRRNARCVAVTVAAILALTFAITGDLVVQRWLATSLESDGRRALFEQIIVAMGDSGARGVGLGGFLEGFRPFKTAQLGRSTWDLAHNSYLENLFELGWPAAAVFYASIFAVALACVRGVFRRRKDRVFPIIGASASVLAAVHASVDFSLQIPAIASAYAVILGLAFAQSWSSEEPAGETSPRSDAAKSGAAR